MLFSQTCRGSWTTKAYDRHLSIFSEGTPGLRRPSGCSVPKDLKPQPDVKQQDQSGRAGHCQHAQPRERDDRPDGHDGDDSHPIPVPSIGARIRDGR